MKYACSLCVLFAICFMWGSVSLAQSQESPWQRPFEVSKPDQALKNTELERYQSSWFPNIAVAPDGSVHVVWYSGKQRTDQVGDSVDFLMYRALRSGRWSQVNPVITTADGGYTVRNGIAMGRDGLLHVTLRSYTSIKYSNAPWQDAWNAQAWQEPYPVSNQNAAYYNSIAVDSRNNLHMVWSEAILDDPNGSKRLCSNCANLFYRSSSDGGRTWAAPINLSNSLDGDNRPQIVIDSRDHIHVVWDQGRDWYAGAGVPKYGIYRRSDDGGKTWKAPVSFAPRKQLPDQRTEDGELKPHPEAPQQITLAVRPNGNPMVVYRTVEGDIFFQLSNNGGDTWTQPRLLSAIRARDTQGDYLDKYSMVADGAGKVHLFVVGYRQEDPGSADARPPELLQLTWNGSGWSDPERVMANELYPEYPTAIVYGNTIHLVWYTRSAEDRLTSDRARYRVWYSSRQVEGAPLPELPLFTPVPVVEPTATVVPTARPMPTPLPTAVLTAPPLERPPAWEAEAIPLMLVAILPVIALFGSVIGFYLIKNRRR
jgi:hypothetical protein